jgi:hypothetical protein
VAVSIIPSAGPSAMTDEEVEVVAEELAKTGGVPWYPGRQQGSLMRLVTNRYRVQARAVVATLDRIGIRAEAGCSQDLRGEEPQGTSPGSPMHQVRPGATVVYHPLEDRRAYPCRIVEIQGDRAYLAPILRTCVGWVSLERLQPWADEMVLPPKEPAVAVMSGLSSGPSGDSKNG